MLETVCDSRKKNITQIKQGWPPPTQCHTHTHTHTHTEPFSHVFCDFGPSTTRWGQGCFNLLFCPYLMRPSGRPGVENCFLTVYRWATTSWCEPRLQVSHHVLMWATSTCTYQLNVMQKILNKTGQISGTLQLTKNASEPSAMSNL